MKLTVEIGRDEELRKEILALIRTEIRSISGEEIREMVKQCMAEQNIAARVVSAFKDLVQREITMFSGHYGKLMAEKMMKDKFNDVIDRSFDEFFKKHALKFLQDYVKSHLESVSGAVNTIKNIIGDKDEKGT